MEEKEGRRVKSPGGVGWTHHHLSPLFLHASAYVTVSVCVFCLRGGGVVDLMRIKLIRHCLAQLHSDVLTGPTAALTSSTGKLHTKIFFFYYCYFSFELFSYFL